MTARHKSMSLDLDNLSQTTTELSTLTATDAASSRVRRSGRSLSLLLGTDVQVAVAWLESFEDYLTFPVGEFKKKIRIFCDVVQFSLVEWKSYPGEKEIGIKNSSLLAILVVTSITAGHYSIWNKLPVNVITTDTLLVFHWDSRLICFLLPMHCNCNVVSASVFYFCFYSVIQICFWLQLWLKCWNIVCEDDGVWHSWVSQVEIHSEECIKWCSVELHWCRTLCMAACILLWHILYVFRRRQMAVYILYSELWRCTVSCVAAILTLWTAVWKHAVCLWYSAADLTKHAAENRLPSSSSSATVTSGVGHRSLIAPPICVIFIHPLQNGLCRIKLQSHQSRYFWIWSITSNSVCFGLFLDFVKATPLAVVRRPSVEVVQLSVWPNAYHWCEVLHYRRIAYWTEVAKLYNLCSTNVKISGQCYNVLAQHLCSK